jgi:hypothetical protein
MAETETRAAVREQKEQKHRLQLDFSSASVDQLNALQQEMDLPNRAEVIRQALRLLNWTLNIHDQGGKIIIETDGRQREVIFPFWTAPASKPRRRAAAAASE